MSISGVEFSTEKIEGALIEQRDIRIPFFKEINDRVRMALSEERDVDLTDLDKAAADIVDYLMNLEAESIFTDVDYEGFNTEAEKEMEDVYGVSFRERVNMSRLGFVKLVDTFDFGPFSEEARELLRVTLDWTEVDLNGRQIVLRWNNESGYKIELSPAVILSQAKLISETTGHEVTREMIETIITMRLGHELGHIVSSAFIDGDFLSQKSSAAAYGLDDMHDFPIQYDFDFDDAIDLAKHVAEERLAAFFARELALGMGGNYNSIIDDTAVDVGRVFSIPLHPNDMGYCLLKAMQNLTGEIAGDDFRMGMLFEFLVEQLYASTSMAEAFPYPKTAAQRILTQAASSRFMV